MTADMLSLLKESASQTFSTMLMVELTPAGADMPEPVWEIFGLIGYVGDVQGNIALGLTRSGAETAVTRFTGEPPKDAEDITDCVGELVNMIAGNAKGRLGDVQVTLSLPEVIQGTGLILDFKLFKQKQSAVFESELGPVKVVFASK